MPGVPQVATNVPRTRSPGLTQRLEADALIVRGCFSKPYHFSFILGKNKNYCKSQQGDCKHIAACDGNAECKFKEKVSRYISYWQCQCDGGFKGNGVQCMDGNGTLSLPSDLRVEVTLSIMKEEYTYPYTSGEFVLGEKMEALNQEMSEVAGGVCNSDNCQSTFNQTEQNN